VYLDLTQNEKHFMDSQLNDVLHFYEQYIKFGNAYMFI
jgi:hypothetical protein